ncbi:MAG: hypothetical protein SOV49_02720 [Erysipelotrichaceae bacterium]|nr:hypothetical protein [Erysipelotrichaceae bacterium]
MKAFFEEYGFAIVAAIVVIALIAIVNNDAFQSTFRTSMSSLVTEFTSFATKSIPAIG